MSREKTTTVLRNCVIAYARAGATKKATTMVTGILQQRTPEGYFQDSQNFACFDADVQAHIMNVASRIADAETSAENSGESSDRPKASVTIEVEGYFQSKAPKEGGEGKWFRNFVITKVALVDSSALA